MGLSQLQTNLADFKFGDPRFPDGKGLSVSNQPYKGNDLHFIGDPNVADLVGNVDENLQGYLDFVLRGGINAPLDSAQDVIRMTKFFTDFKSFRGPGFIAKENILSRISVATQASGNQKTPDKYQNAALNQGTYSPLRTIAQVGVNAFGGHLVKQTLTPFGLKSILTYTDVVKGKDSNKEKSIVSVGNNRLVQFLANQDMLAAVGEGNAIDKFGNVVSNVNLYSYSGGPNSVLGIGKTHITFATDAKGAPLRTTDYTRDFVKFPTLSEEKKDDYGGSRFFKSGIDNGAINYTRPPLNKAARILGASLKYIQGRKGQVNFLPSVEDPSIEDTGKIEGKVGNQVIIDVQNASNREYLSFGGVDYGGDFTARSPFSKNPKVWNTFTQNQINDVGTDGINNPFSGSIFLENNQTVYNDPSIKDFRVPLLDESEIQVQGSRGVALVPSSNIMSIAPSYSGPNSKAIEGISDSRIKQISPGQKGDIVNYQKGKVNVDGKISVVDHINYQPLYRSSRVRSTKSGVAKNDFVKFRIAAIERSGKKVFIHFRAFIDSFSDNYSSNWDSINYMGRGESFYKYGGFGRKISLSFTVAAQSKPELMAQYKKLNYLASTLAPDYGGNGYMGGVLTTLTLGGWCYELPGFIDNLTLDVPQESPWEISIPATDDGGDPNNPIFSDNTVKEMPHICKVTMNFTPIHTFRPELQKNSYRGDGGEVSRYDKQRYLALSNGINNNYKAVSLAEAQTDQNPNKEYISPVKAESTTALGNDPQTNNDDLYLKDGSTIGDRERAANDPNPFIPG